MNHEPNLLPEQCQPEELIVFLSLRPRYLNSIENGDLGHRYLAGFAAILLSSIQSPASANDEQ
jgi:hypothetical protein